MAKSEATPPAQPYCPFLLRQGLNAAGITQRELARRMGWKENYVSRLACGQATPSWKTAVSIALAIGVSLDLFRDNPSPPLQIGPMPEPQPARRRRRKESVP